LRQLWGVACTTRCRRENIIAHFALLAFPKNKKGISKKKKGNQNRKLKTKKEKPAYRRIPLWRRSWLEQSTRELW
jgi:hypothetical protein